MMTLALELGIPLGQVGLMTEREFACWMRYSSRKGLPSRRAELYLAQIAWWIAQTNGVKESTLADFLFDEATEDADEEDELEAAKAALGFKPRKQKEG